MDLPLEIPPSDFDALAQLVGLKAEEMAQLTGALRSATPTLSANRLAREVTAKGKLDLATTKRILRVLRSMYRIRIQLEAPLDELVNAVMVAIGRASKDRATLRLDEERASRLRAELRDLLSLDDTLGVSARGMQVLQEHERTLCTARILTDARPVFRPDVTQDPAAMVLTHTLRLDYHTRRTDSHEVESFYVALDASDLRDLRHLIDRALAKEETVRRVIVKGGVRVLPEDDAEEDGHGH